MRAEVLRQHGRQRPAGGECVGYLPCILAAAGLRCGHHILPALHSLLCELQTLDRCRRLCLARILLDSNQSLWRRHVGPPIWLDKRGVHLRERSLGSRASSSTAQARQVCCTLTLVSDAAARAVPSCQQLYSRLCLCAGVVATRDGMQLTEGCWLPVRSQQNLSAYAAKVIRELDKEVSQLDLAKDQVSGPTEDAAQEAAESAQTLLRRL